MSGVTIIVSAQLYTLIAVSQPFFFVIGGLVPVTLLARYRFSAEKIVSRLAVIDPRPDHLSARSCLRTWTK